MLQFPGGKVGVEARLPAGAQVVGCMVEVMVMPRAGMVAGEEVKKEDLELVYVVMGTRVKGGGVVLPGGQMRGVKVPVMELGRIGLEEFEAKCEEAERGMGGPPPAAAG